jgi:hypothetical protein
VWWSTFGILKLLEANFGVTNIPFYSIIKIVLLTSLYLTEYRSWMTQNTSQYAVVVTDKLRRLLFTVLNEHFPSIKQYINIDLPPVVEPDMSKEETTGWLSGMKTWLAGSKE